MNVSYFQRGARSSRRHSGESRNPGGLQPPFLDSGFRRNDKLTFVANQESNKGKYAQRD
jgi:hypothetical protein